MALAASHDREAFDCGVAELNDFLRTKARQYAKKKIAQTFVAFPVAHPKQIDGFYSLSMSSVEVSSVPESVRKKYPKHPLPVALMGRLATSTAARGQGLGELMLMDALRRIIHISEEVGCAAVIVDAKDPKAASFYKKYGFIQLQDPPNRLFIPIDVAQEAFDE